MHLRMTVSWLHLSTLTWTSFLNIYKKKKKGLPGNPRDHWACCLVFGFFFSKKMLVLKNLHLLQIEKLQGHLLGRCAEFM